MLSLTNACNVSGVIPIFLNMSSLQNHTQITDDFVCLCFTWFQIFSMDIEGIEGMDGDWLA